MLASVGVKALSGKEDTTLLSMADCRVKQRIELYGAIGPAHKTTTELGYKIKFFETFFA